MTLGQLCSHTSVFFYLRLSGSVFSGTFTYAAHTILLESVIFNNYQPILFTYDYLRIISASKFYE